MSSTGVVSWIASCSDPLTIPVTNREDESIATRCSLLDRSHDARTWSIIEPSTPPPPPASMNYIYTVSRRALQRPKERKKRKRHENGVATLKKTTCFLHLEERVSWIQFSHIKRACISNICICK